MFGLVVRFTLKDGATADFDRLIQITVPELHRHEPGTLVYACHTVDGAPRERIFYELYASRAAFDGHEHQEHTRRFLTQRQPLLESTHVDFLSLTGGKTPVSDTELRNA